MRDKTRTHGRPQSASPAGVFAARRRAALAAAVKQAEKQGAIDAFLVTGPRDVGYLSGFTGEDSWLVFGAGWACLLTDGRFGEQAPAQCPGIEVRVRTGGQTLSMAASAKMKCNRARRLAVQGEQLTMVQHAAIQKALADGVGKRARTVSVADVVLGLRAIKDEGEIRRIRKAIAAAEKAFLEMTSRGARWFIGKTENQLAAELEYLMRQAGASAPSFETIIGTGAHGSLCHYRPADTKVRRGEAVLIDWGAVVDGYCSDLTRVVFVDTIPPKLAEVYEVVRQAQEAAIAAFRAGAAAKRADIAARSVIEKAGYGDKFVHGLGHGIGRQVHELPGIGKLSKVRLRAGMVVTAEPGIYLPGIGGVRIEDDVLITSTGRKRLSTLSRDLESMVLQ